jgi:hypothetical protein
MTSRTLMSLGPLQAVATGPTEASLHDARTAEVAEHLGQEAHRDVLARGDRPGGDQVDAIHARQRQHGADGVGAAVRQI